MVKKESRKIELKNMSGIQGSALGIIVIEEEVKEDSCRIGVEFKRLSITITHTNTYNYLFYPQHYIKIKLNSRNLV